MVRISVLTVLMFISGFANAGIDWNEGNIKWYGYLDGLIAAKKEIKRAIVVVYAEWCHVCKKYSRMFRDPAVIEQSKNVILIKMDQDKDKLHLGRFNLDGEYVPRTYLLDRDLSIMTSPYKSKKYSFYLAPERTEYLAKLMNSLK